MASRRRIRGLARLTFCASLVGIFLSFTLISTITVATDSPLPVPAGLHFAHTGGYETRYQEWGALAKHPIVLIHGAFESVALWRPVAQLLSANHHVEAYDLKGYGFTSHVAPYTTRSLSQQLYQFLLARKLQHPVLVGHSLGAGVIAQFVLDHPHIAAGIVFLDGDGLQLSYPGGAIMSVLPVLYLTALYDTVIRSGFVLRSIYEAACGPDCPPFTNRVLNDIQRPLETAGAQQALLAFAQHPIVGVATRKLARIKRFHIPSLVVFGAKDAEFSKQAAFETAARLGAQPPTIIPNAGHLSMWSHPQQVALAISIFSNSLK